MFVYSFLSVIVVPEPKEEKKSNAGKIAGGVVGGIVFLILVGIAIFLILRWKSEYSLVYFTQE